MKGPYLWSLLLLFGCADAKMRITATSMQELTVPNIYTNDPPCAIKLPQTNFACTAEGCSVPGPKGNTLGTIKLDFSCLPKRSPTGFDNPADDVKVLRLRSRNSLGHLSLIDDAEGDPENRLRYLDFCLYGRKTNFCGGAKVLRLKDGEKADPTAAIKAFIEGIALQEPLLPTLNK